MNGPPRPTCDYSESFLESASQHSGESDQAASEQHETGWFRSDIGRDLGNRKGLEIFFCGGVFVFLQGVLAKTGGRTWFFDGEFVVDCGVFVVN
jgi:hypothetical protein